MQEIKARDLSSEALSAFARYGKAHAKLKASHKGGSERDIAEAQEDVDRIRQEIDRLSEEIYAKDLPEIERERHSIQRRVFTMDDIERLVPGVGPKNVKNWISRGVLAQPELRPGKGRALMFSAGDLIEIIIVNDISKFACPATAKEIAPILLERCSLVYQTYLSEAASSDKMKAISAEHSETPDQMAMVVARKGDGWIWHSAKVTELHSHTHDFYYVIACDRIAREALNAVIEKIGPASDILIEP